MQACADLSEGKYKVPFNRCTSDKTRGGVVQPSAVSGCDVRTKEEKKGAQKDTMVGKNRREEANINEV